LSEQAEIQFGREICGDLAAAESREWLVTNGIGGYASGTVAGTLTRRYHGLLIAALQPPLGRTQLVASFDEIVHYSGADFSLATHRWSSGAIDPKGFLSVESFHLEGTTPVWTFALADALLESASGCARAKIRLTFSTRLCVEALQLKWNSKPSSITAISILRRTPVIGA